MALRSGSERLKRIHSRVKQVKENEEVGLRYLRIMEEMADERAEGREEGRKEGIEEGRKEGIEEGRKEVLKEQVKKKLAKDLSHERIAEELELDVATVHKLIEEIKGEQQ